MTMKEMKKVKNLIADSVSLTCPYCDKVQSLFDGDPSGDSFDCMDCGEVYEVDKHAMNNISF